MKYYNTKKIKIMYSGLVKAIRMYIQSIAYRSILLYEKTKVTVINNVNILNNMFCKRYSSFSDHKPPRDFQMDSYIFAWELKLPLLHY